MMMKVTELWTLRIEHNYYLQKATQEMNVQIVPEMRMLLMRRNLLWRRKDTGEWCLVSVGDYSLDNEDTLELEVIATGLTLPYITDFDWPLGNVSQEVEVPFKTENLIAKECIGGKKVRTGTPHCILKLRVPMGQMITPKEAPLTTTLTFESGSKYWEYLIVPRQPEAKNRLRLEDTKGTVSFTEGELIDFMGHQAYQFRSLDKLPLRDRYPHIDLVLWEKFSINGAEKERALLRSLPHPDPALTLGTAKDTVCKILYY